MSDRIFGGIGLLVAIIFAWQASIIQDSFMTDAVGPRVFPYLIAMVMGISSIWFILKPDTEPHWPTLGRMAEIGMAAAVMFAYAVLLPKLGFIIATALAAGYLTWRLGSKPVESVVIGIGTSVGIYVVFRMILGLSLASGPLGF